MLGFSVACEVASLARVCGDPAVKAETDHNSGMRLANGASAEKCLEATPPAVQVHRLKAAKPAQTIADCAACPPVTPGARCVGAGIIELHEDGFPLACVTPFSKLTAAIRGPGVPTIFSHPHGSLETYFFIDQEDQVDRSDHAVCGCAGNSAGHGRAITQDDEAAISSFTTRDRRCETCSHGTSTKTARHGA